MPFFSNGSRRACCGAMRRTSRPFHAWVDGWQLGTPDLVVAMPQAYVLPAQSTGRVPDLRHPDSCEVGLVREGGGISSRQPSRLFTTPTSRSIARGCQGGAMKTSLVQVTKVEGAVKRGSRTGLFLGWTPGQSPRESPDGMSWHLEPQQRSGRGTTPHAGCKARAGASRASVSSLRIGRRSERATC